MNQPQKIDIQENTQFGIFRSKKSFIVSLLGMGVILGFYHQWYEILAKKPQDFVLIFYQNFPATSLKSILRLLPLLVPFYFLLNQLRKWPIWKRLFLFLMLAIGTTLIEESMEYYIPILNSMQNNPNNPRFLAFLSFDMLGDILLFFGILSGLGYVDHILCRNNILFTRLMKEKARLAEEEKLRLMADFEALQNQINPHFLFNTLNSLATLIVSNPEKAEGLIRDMSDWYRDTLRMTQQSSWTIQNEIELIENYLRIESVRLEERLIVDIRCEKEALKIEIPPLILQPLVENAVLHGIAPSVSGGTLSVKIEGKTHRFKILVEDKRHDCDLVEETHPTGTGSGLQNIKRRLELAFGKDLQFRFKVGKRGAVARIAVNRGFSDK